MANKGKEQWLVFVDTNVLLDFYRLRGNSVLRQLEALEKHKDLLITGEQVWMEFLKHRQRVIKETLTDLKKPTDQKLPPILADYQPAKMMKKHLASAENKYKEVKLKAERIIADPTHHDAVYKKVNRILLSNTRHNLTRKNKVRFEVRNLARKRFSLGYPPRKKDDTSIGDAFNWEWIIRCAQDCQNNSHILIVSRDGDFGIDVGDQTFLNDWLKKEFKERVSKKRKIELTTRLTVAMKRLDEVVTKEDEEEEENLISATSGRARSLSELFRPSRSAAARVLLGDYDFDSLLEEAEAADVFSTDGSDEDDD